MKPNPLRFNKIMGGRIILKQVKFKGSDINLPWLSSLLITHQSHIGELSVLGKVIAKSIFSGLPGETTNEDFPSNISLIISDIVLLRVLRSSLTIVALLGTIFADAFLLLAMIFLFFGWVHFTINYQ